ncbi:type I secretion C-terminal target domain-containing protein [Planococcaceae bacterium Storch 2/2-2]|nr:type I secretion C-terminal target domain-containing protein [Planococcaceae bacterium Storch 2/2-2]
MNDSNLSKEDKDALRKEIDKAKDVQKDPNASGKDVEDATNGLNDKVKEIEDKQKEDAKPSEKEVEDLTNALENAKEKANDPNLSPEDKDALDQAIKDAENLFDKDGNVKDDVSKDDVNNAKDKLEEAVNKAGEDEVTVKDAEAAVSDARQKVKDYTSAKPAAKEKAFQDAAKALKDAKDKVAALEAGKDQDRLAKELGEIAVDFAKEAVKAVEGNLSQDTIDQAQQLVDQIPDSVEGKQELQNLLDEAQKAVDTVKDAIDAIEKANKDVTKENVAAAKEAVEKAKKLNDKLVSQEEKAALDKEIEKLETKLAQQDFGSELEKAEHLHASTMIDEDGANLYDDEQYVTQAEADALEQAIADVKNAKNANELKGAELALKEALKPYEANKKFGKKSQAVEDATKAVEKAEESKRNSDKETAQQLINAIGPKYETEKEALQNRLDAVKTVTKTKDQLKDALAKAETEQKAGKGEFSDDAWKALEDAIKKGKATLANDKATEDEVTKATEALEIAVENLTVPVRLAQVVTKDAPMSLQPDIKKEMDTLGKDAYEKKYHKAAGGVLGLNIGILDLGLLSTEQINKISDSHRHSVKVEEGTVFTGDVRISFHSVLGGHQVKVHTFKKNEETGEYHRIATRTGGVGSLLGIPIPTYLDVGFLEEGEYELVLEVGGGISVVQGIPYQIVDATIYDYRNSADNATVKGNIFGAEGATKGEENTAFVESITGGEKNTRQLIDQETTETELQGKYGKLYVAPNGDYRYEPVGQRKNIGNYEEFTFKAVNPTNDTTSEGILRVRLDNETVEWAENGTDVKIVEANDKEGKTSVRVDKTFTTVENAAKASNGWTSKGEEGYFHSNKFEVQDADAEVTFELSKRGKETEEVVIEFFNHSTGKVEKEAKSQINNDWQLQEVFTGLPKGEYSVRVKSVLGNDTRVHIQNITTKSSNWGQYAVELKATPDVSGNFFEDNYLGAKEERHGETRLFVKGRDVAMDDKDRYLETKVDAQGNFVKKGDDYAVAAKHVAAGQLTEGMYRPIAKESSFKEIRTQIRDSKDSNFTAIAGEHGILEVTTDGNYTYKPFNRIAAAGHTEVFEYELLHPTGNKATAKLTITIDPLTEVTEEKDIVTSTPKADQFKTLGGSDTVVFPVFNKVANDGGNNHNTWVDFTYGTVETNKEADRLDLRLLFTGQTINEKNLNQYMKLVSVKDGSATLQIDRDGAGKEFEMTNLITLKGDITADVTLQQLIENGQILY